MKLRHLAVRTILLPLAVVALRPHPARGQEVILLHGAGYSPSSISEGQRLAVSTNVSADQNTFVVLSFRWPSDVDAYPCEAWMIVTGGSYRVADESTPGRCDFSDEAAAAQAFSGDRPVHKLVFYGDPSYDVPAPERVQRSHQASALPHRKLADLRREPGPTPTPKPAPTPTPKPTPKPTPAPKPLDLTGTWAGNDGGTYYVRQIGNRVWWVGMSADDGKSWTNTFIGMTRNDSIFGTWADVPRGAARSSGRMTLIMNGATAMRAVSKTGGFGGSVWRRKP